MNAAIRAVRNLDEEDRHAGESDLGADIERALGMSGKVLRFTAPNHEATVELQADLHRNVISKHTKDIAERKRALKSTVAEINAEIDRLKGEIVAAKAGATEANAADEKIIAASKAWLAVIDQ